MSQVTSELGPLPTMPALQHYPPEVIYNANVDELRRMVWTMNESMAKMNQEMDDIMGTIQRREAELLTRIHTLESNK